MQTKARESERERKREGEKEKKGKEKARTKERGGEGWGGERRATQTYADAVFSSNCGHLYSGDAFSSNVS